MIRGVSLALKPIAGVFDLAVRVRNTFYQSGLFRTREVGAPVFSVGNLTTGGTGKTPVVARLARELAQGDRRVCILTRGYGRETTGRVVVSDGDKILSDALQSGDEPLLLAEALKGVAVISDADRISAAHWAIKNLRSNLFLLDDGFQHQRIARDLNILTIDAVKPWGNGKLLPAGNLREPATAMARADCIIVTRADDDQQFRALKEEIQKICEPPIFRSHFQIASLREVGEKPQPLNLDRIKSLPVGAFCGIGSPDSFFDLLRRNGYQIVHTQAFRDHHLYTQTDIDRVIQNSAARGAQFILTTAKDEVKLRSLTFRAPVLAVDVEIVIDGFENLRELLLNAITKHQAA